MYDFKNHKYIYSQTFFSIRHASISNGMLVYGNNNIKFDIFTWVRTLHLVNVIILNLTSSLCSNARNLAYMDRDFLT
jgi:hypothetical protein